MYEVKIKYNPYKLETDIQVNGNPVPRDSELHSLKSGRRMQEWIVNFPAMLRETYNAVDFAVDFYGMSLDYDDVKEAFTQAVDNGVLDSAQINLHESRSNEAIVENVAKIFNDLHTGPVPELRDPILKKKFERISEAVFPVNVIATMSSGKSTLINALLGTRLMPSKNEACTAVITEITDNDKDFFEGAAYDKDDNQISAKISNLTYENMDELNSNNKVFKVKIDGDITFIDAITDVLMLVDTPGPNNSQNQGHKDITYRALNSESNNLILYVLNGTQLGTNDDASLLDYVAEQMKKGSKEIRDRFMFVINKMDGFNPEEESIEGAINRAKEYLSAHGIENPQIFPCSAYTALNIRTHLKDVDLANLTRAEERRLPNAAKDTIAAIYKFLDNENMHLEKYTTLSPTAQNDIAIRLKKAIEAEDEKEQALIHSGIYSIEAAITAYVKKYAKTKKVKDLVESFQATLNASEVFTKAKKELASNEAAAKAFEDKAAAIKAKINDGKEADRFKAEINRFNPMKKLEDKVKQLRKESTRKVQEVFERYDDVIETQREAKRMVNDFTRAASDQVAALSSEIEGVVNREVIAAGESLLAQYRKKLEIFDQEAAHSSEFELKTGDLVQGELQKMRDSIKNWRNDSFAEVTINENSETTVREEHYSVKVGQEEERIIVGTHEEKIGTRKVKVGSHQEVSHYESDSHWYNPFSWGRKKAIYKTVDDYKDEDVYKTVTDYDTVMRDIYEDRTRVIEEFRMDLAAVSAKLLAPYDMAVEDGMNDALKVAREQIENMKSQFIKMFDKLDSMIKQKFTELEECIRNKDSKQEEIEENKRLVEWIECNKRELDGILDM